MSKKKKWIIISIILIVCIIISILAYMFIIKKEEPLPDVKTIEVLDKIKGYEYNLEDRDTSIYKENFLKLKEVLESETVNFKEYTTLVAKLFIIDLYTLENKISKYDVGALEFIYPEEKEKFQNKIMDTLYKLLEDNSMNTRKQELPIVQQVEIKNMIETTYKKENKILNGYKVNATIFYEKELKYDKELSLTLVKEDNNIYIVNVTPIN